MYSVQRVKGVVCYESVKPPSHRWEGGVAFNLTNPFPGGEEGGVKAWLISHMPSEP